MARYLVKFKPQIKALVDADSGTPVPAYDLTVVASQPGNEWAVIETDDPDVLLQAGVVESVEEENEFFPLGIIAPPTETFFPAANTMGQDLPLVGVTLAWQERVQGGSQVILGIADTGTPPGAATEAHWPDTYNHVVHGRLDTHGHQTACTSRMVGPRGVLPRCKMIVHATALPGGRGTTTSVTQAIRVLADWASADGQKVHCINLSLGGPPDPVIQGEVRRAQDMGIPCSAAAGNDGPNARIGSPADVAQFVWGATTLDGQRTASFSSGGNQWTQQTGAIPGESVGVAHLDGGYGTASGTSFSAPVGTAIVGSLRALGMTVPEIQAYCRSHQVPLNPPRASGRLVVQASDIGQEPPPEEPPVDLHEIEQAIRESSVVMEHLDTARYEYRDLDNEAAWTHVGEASRVQGHIRTRLIRFLDNLPKVPPPEEPPGPEKWLDPRTALRGFAAKRHWQGSPEGVYAIDWYAGPLGTPIGWLQGGTVRGRADMGPLYLEPYGHDCPALAHELRESYKGLSWLPEGTHLYTAILDCDDGETMIAITHVLQQAKLGEHVEPWEPFCALGDSGIETLRNAAHLHLAIKKSTAEFGHWQGGMGNVPVLEYLGRQGFVVQEVPRIPSPQDYLRGCADAGKILC